MMPEKKEKRPTKTMGRFFLCSVGFLIHLDVFVDVLRTPEGVEEQEGEANDNHPVALEIADTAQAVNDGVLEQGQDATTADQSHEDARSLFGVLA